ncbi:MAG: hypothetical protein ABI763_11895, partial [Bacteroidota bacterium]
PAAGPSGGQDNNKLQQQFFEHLRAERNSTDDEFISMEENFVDIKFENKNCIELYEVKTSPHARGCIREALGQLIFYASKISSKKKMKLFVIGPSEMKESDRAYFNFVKDNLSLPFEYLPFRLQTGNI